MATATLHRPAEHHADHTPTSGGGGVGGPLDGGGGRWGRGGGGGDGNNDGSEGSDGTPGTDSGAPGFVLGLLVVVVLAGFDPTLAAAALALGVPIVAVVLTVRGRARHT